jgi:low molecular weight protein-tyrosine phosphatase
MNVLFVCLGNICRSPLAQGIFEHQLRERNLQDQIGVDSCGTAAFNLGNPPDPRAIEAGLRAGYDIRHQVARMFGPEDFERFEFIVPMDNINMMNLRGLVPENYQGELKLFRRFSQAGGDPQIADPYHKNDTRFDALVPELEHAARGLLDYIESKN